MTYEHNNEHVKDSDDDFASYLDVIVQCFPFVNG